MESVIDIEVDVADETVQALVSPRMSGFRPTATALDDACGWSSVIWTSPVDSGGVAVLEGGGNYRVFCCNCMF